MSVIRFWLYEFCKMVGGTSSGLEVGGVPLVYECCKIVDGTSCGLGIGGGGQGVPLVYECCKVVGV